LFFKQILTDKMYGTQKSDLDNIAQKQKPEEYLYPDVHVKNTSK